MSQQRTCLSPPVLPVTASTISPIRPPSLEPVGLVAGLEGVGLPPVCALLPLFCWVEEPGMEVETTEEGPCDVPVEDTQASTASE